MTDLNAMAVIVHKANIKWWEDIDTGKPIQRNKLELLALVITEISECLEGERKNAMDDKLPHRKMAEVEMADAYIRLLDFSAGFEVSVYRVELRDPIPDNKGEALFRIMSAVIRIESSNSGEWISLCLAYIEAYCTKHGYDLQGAFDEKMAYNAKREDHKHEARRIAGGKQF